MPIGLQVFRDTNTLQIDSDVLTVSFLGKFTISGWTRGSTIYRAALSLPKATKFVLFGETGASSSIAVRSVVLTASSADYEFWSNTADSVVCYCFGDAPVAPSRCGLQLFDSAGNLTFDSNNKILRISAVYETSLDTQSFSLPVAIGRTYACGISNYDTRYRQNQVGQNLAFMVMIRSVRVSGGTVMSGLLANQGPPTTSPPANSPIGPMPVIMVADVTGF